MFLMGSNLQIKYKRSFLIQSFCWIILFNVIPPISEDEELQSHESRSEDESGSTTKRSQVERSRKSKNKKNSNRGSDSQTVELEDNVRETENSEVSDQKKSKKVGKNKEKKRATKGDKTPEFILTECNEYYLDFEDSERHQRQHHSEPNLVITHITVHHDDTNRERIKVKCCQLVFTWQF